MIEITEAMHGFLCQNCFGREDVKEINIHVNGTGAIIRLCVNCRKELAEKLKEGDVDG